MPGVQTMTCCKEMLLLRPNDDGSPREMRMRDGHPCWIAALLPCPSSDGYALIGWSVDGALSTPIFTARKWVADGRYYVENISSPKDIVHIVHHAPAYRDVYVTVFTGSRDKRVCLRLNMETDEVVVVNE